MKTYKTKNASIIKRRRELHRKLILLGCSTMVIIFGLIMFVCSSKSVASDGSIGEYNKYYMNISVTSEDSLLEIANTYAIPEVVDVDDYIREVMFINQLESEELPYGERNIIVPYYISPQFS